MSNSSNPAVPNSQDPSTWPPKAPGLEEWADRASKQVIDNLNKAREAQEAQQTQKSK